MALALGSLSKRAMCLHYTLAIALRARDALRETLTFGSVRFEKHEPLFSSNLISFTYEVSFGVARLWAPLKKWASCFAAVVVYFTKIT